MLYHFKEKLTQIEDWGKVQRKPPQKIWNSKQVNGMMPKPAQSKNIMNHKTSEEQPGLDHVNELSKSK